MLGFWVTFQVAARPSCILGGAHCGGGESSLDSFFFKSSCVIKVQNKACLSPRSASERIISLAFLFSFPPCKFLVKHFCLFAASLWSWFCSGVLGIVHVLLFFYK